MLHGLHPETFDAQSWALLLPLIRENHAAAGVAVPMNVDLDLLRRCNPLLWILWDRGVPVGYCAHLLSPHIFTGELTATCCAIYVRPPWRMQVRSMLAIIEGDLVARGAVVINYGVPAESRAALMLGRRGYTLSEVAMVKRCVAPVVA